MRRNYSQHETLSLIARQRRAEEGRADRENRADAEATVRAMYAAMAGQKHAEASRNAAVRALADAEDMARRRAEGLESYKIHAGPNATVAAINEHKGSIDIALAWVASCRRDLADADLKLKEAADRLAAAQAAHDAEVAA